MSDDDEPLFHLDGDLVIPGRHTVGPWDPGAQHGGPACALLTWAAERIPTLVPMRVARMSFDLARPVPVAPLRVDARVRREGKRLQIVEAAILGGPRCDEEVAFATVLRLRRGESAAVAAAAAPALPAPPPWLGDGVSTTWFAARGIEERTLPPYLHALELSPAHPHAVWFRLPRDVVAGEETLPTMRLAAVADFASGVGQRLDIGALIAVNPDVSVQVFREPSDEWICVESSACYGADAIGQTSARLFDRQGYVAAASTALLVDQVPSAGSPPSGP